MSLPYFPMYPTDFEADTSHLTLLEDGVYNRLLRLCWMTPGCSVPADEAWVTRRLRARSDEEIEAVRTVISEFFITQKKRWVSPRLLQEFKRANAVREKQRENGKKGGRPAKALKNNETDQSDGLAKQKPKKAHQNQNQILPDTNVSGADEPPLVIDATKDAIWKRGVPFLCENGVAEVQARSLIGKWLKENGAQAVFDALAAAKREQTGDPVPYITEILKPPLDVRSVVAKALGRASNE